MTVKVWSEREPGRWDECTEAAYLMTLLFGGFTRFPLGAYTDAERDALEMAAEGPVVTDTGSSFPIIDKGALKRYGVRLRQIPDGSSLGLRAKLSQAGRALAMAGTYGHLVAGHSLRRWQPTFTGGHAVCAVPLGGGRVLWLDPLAPDDHPGDLTDVATAMAFAFIPNDAREALAGEFAQEDDMIDPTKHIPAGLADVGPVTVWADPDRTSRLVDSWGGGTNIQTYWTIAPPFPTPTPLVPIRVNMSGPTKPPDWRVGWVGADKVTIKTPSDGGAEARIGAAAGPLADGMAAIKTAEGAIGAAVTALKG
jgi:hypothetical protein